MIDQPGGSVGKGQGYRGLERAVYRYLAFLQASSWESAEITTPHPQERFSAKKAVWLFIREPEILETMAEIQQT